MSQDETTLNSEEIQPVAPAFIDLPENKVSQPVGRKKF